MKEPVQAKGRSEREPLPRNPATARSREAALAVHFYRRMKLQRVHKLVVQQAASPLASMPFIVRPIIPGALVTPVECPLDTSNPKARATFHVTPLARGRLSGARLEVLNLGQVVHEVPLRMKSVTQRATWVLAALTILVPALMLYFTRYHPLKGEVMKEVRRADLGLPEEPEVKRGPVPRMTPPPGMRPGTPPRMQAPEKKNGGEEQADDPPKQKDSTSPTSKSDGEPKKKADTPSSKSDEAPKKKDDAPAAKSDDQPKKKADTSPSSKSDEAPRKKDDTPAGKSDDQPKTKADTPANKSGDAKKDEPKKQESEEGAGKGTPPAIDRPPTVKSEYVRFSMPGEPGEVLTEEIVKNVPAIPGDFLSDEETQSKSVAERQKYTRSVVQPIGDFYGWLCRTAVDHVAFYVGLVLLLGTGLSFLLHTRLRGWQRSSLPLTGTES
jgi:hypothetical protein